MSAGGDRNRQYRNRHGEAQEQLVGVLIPPLRNGQRNDGDGKEHEQEGSYAPKWKDQVLLSSRLELISCAWRGDQMSWPRWVCFNLAPEIPNKHANVLQLAAIVRLPEFTQQAIVG